MRATLKTLLVTLPLGAGLAVLPTFWEGASGRARVVLIGAIVAVWVGLAAQSWLTSPARQPVGLLRRGIKRRAARLPADAVVKNPHSNMYVYVQYANSTITLWCFHARWIERLEKEGLTEKEIFAHGFRIDPATDEVTNYYSKRALLRRNPDGTFAIVPPSPYYEDQWRVISELFPQYRGLLHRTKVAISKVTWRGFFGHFHK